MRLRLTDLPEIVGKVEFAKVRKNDRNGAPGAAGKRPSDAVRGRTYLPVITA